MKTQTYTWAQLNRLLINTPSERVVLRIFEQQKAAGASERWLGRIWSRYARLRARRERKELTSKRLKAPTGTTEAGAQLMGYLQANKGKVPAPRVTYQKEERL